MLYIYSINILYINFIILYIEYVTRYLGLSLVLSRPDNFSYNTKRHENLVFVFTFFCTQHGKFMNTKYTTKM